MPVTAAGSRVRRIAVAGNPNSGKTSVFNALTGLRARVANYHGVTVEKREGRLAGSDISLVDLPGVYSLSARSPDEVIARDVLLGLVKDEAPIDALLIVIDAANLERNLYLATQLIEFNLPTVVACNMMDIALRRGRGIDPDRLAVELGVPVIPTVARTTEGMSELRQALLKVQGGPLDRPRPRGFVLPAEIELAVDDVAETLAVAGVEPPAIRRAAALLYLTNHSTETLLLDSQGDLAQRLPEKDGMRIRAVADALISKFNDPTRTIIEARYNWISDVVRRAALPDGGAVRRSRTDRIDAIVTHRIWGVGIFAAVMFALFFCIFRVAEPLMGAIEMLQTAVADAARAYIPAGPVQSLVADGIIGGVGAVVVFLPQICLLFVFLAVLEDTGYIARAAFLMDRIMCRVGLHGRSFIPLLSSYACAIPGILATRTIEHPRDRLATILIAPLFSCSARLPVYLIVIGAVFGANVWLKTSVLFGLYALGTAAAFLVALVLKRSILRGPAPTFIMELPPYHLPLPLSVLRTAWDRSKSFLKEAGTIIFAACVVIWALSYFPRLDVSALPPAEAAQLAQWPDDAPEHAQYVQSLRLRQSALGRLGRLIEPIIEPLGYDWRLGIGILSSFLAREVFVGTMGITFALGDTDEDAASLRDRLSEAQWPDGRRLMTPLAGISLLIFYVFACQCVSTLAVVRKETGTWKWPAFLFAYMTLLAYGLSLATFQIGRALGYA